MAVSVTVKSLVIASICCISVIQAQSNDRIAIRDESSACLSESTLSIQCPPEHMVVLRSAKYFKSLEPGCNVDSSNRCEVEDVQFAWFFRCYLKSECHIGLKLSSAASTCAGYTGETFLMVSYKCDVFIGDSYLTHSRDLCNMDAVWEGPLLFLYSPAFPHWNTEPDCGCSVTVHSSIQLEITLTQFQSADENSNDCDQVFQIQSGSQEMRMCSEHHKRDFQPLDMEYDSNVHFKFENTARENYMFLLVLQVHHEQNVTVQCHKDYTMPSLPTTPTHVVAERKQHSAVAAHWPIITGVVIVICSCLVVSMAVLLFCRRQNKKKRGSTTKLAFDNDTYMTSERAATPRNQTIINMNNIDKTHPPKHQEITSQRRDTTPVSPKLDVESEISAQGKEEMGVQTDVALPRDTKGTITEPKGKAQAKHPSLSNLGGKTLVDLRQTYPDIPESVLTQLGCQSEATIAITKPNLKGVARENKPVSKPNEPTVATPKQEPPKSDAAVPFHRATQQRASLTNLGVSVKDRARLLKNNSFNTAEKKSAVQVCDSSDVTPYSSMTDLSVKDKAKLMSQQLKNAKD